MNKIHKIKNRIKRYISEKLYDIANSITYVTKNDLEEEMEDLSSTMDSLKDRVDDLEDRSDDLEGAIGDLESKDEELQDEIDNVKCFECDKLADLKR